MEKVALMSAVVISLFFVLGAVSTRVENRRRNAAEHRSSVPSVNMTVTASSGSFAGMDRAMPNRTGSAAQGFYQEVTTSARAIGE